ncbi:Fc.00g002080.m01.CDS01 [Cosmosporella sp. VM-42]
MASYVVSVSNKSGAKKSYAIFAETPKIETSAGSLVQTTTRIISSARAVPSDKGQATFVPSKDWYTISGTDDVDLDRRRRDDNRKKFSSGITVMDHREVQLGFKDPPSTLMSGTFLEVECADVTLCFSDSGASYPLFPL